MSRFKLVRWCQTSAFVSLLIIATACGSYDNPTSPTTSATGRRGATITGTYGGAGSAVNTAQDSTVTPQATAASVTILVTGTGLSTTVAPGEAFLLSGVPAGNVELRIIGTGTDTRITIANVVDGETIRVNVNNSGSRITIDVTERDQPDSKSEIEGRIAAIDPGARTMIVDALTISVPTTTRIRKGQKDLALTDLKVGQRVHVRGTPSGSMLVASEVTLQDEDGRND